LDYLDEECRQDFDKVQSILTQMKIPYTVNPGIVRGLDYYTKTAFEYINNNLGAQNALAGGGRYDGLVKQLGGSDVPGVGFAGGFERLILSMENEALKFGGENRPDIFAVALGEEARTYYIALLEDLRKAGFSLDFAPDRTTLKSQMKVANRSGARFCLILGEDELQRNEIILKDMNSGEQQSSNLVDLVDSLSNILPDRR